MTLSIALTYGIILVALWAMAREWMPADLTLMAALGVLIAAGVVELEDALQGFADPTLLALGALFVVAGGLRLTGVLRKAADLLFGEETRERGVLLRLTSAAASSSAFLNNTPIVAMATPAVLSWTRDRPVSPAKLLIPLSYASILGGVCTLIGTSTNLVADGMLRSHGEEGLGFFELGAVGLPLAVVGIAYLVVAAPRLLHPGASVETEVSEGTVASDIHLVRVPEGSRLAGQSLSDATLGQPDLQLVRMVRSDGTVATVAPDARILAGDRLTFRGSSRVMDEVVDRYGLAGEEVPELPGGAGEADLREAVVPEGSDLVGEALRDADFLDRFNAAVLGLVRNGRQVEDLRRIRLRAGDVLFLVARPGFGRSFADSRHLHLLAGDELAEEGRADVPLWQPTRARTGLAILGGVVVLATAGVVHISVAALGGAFLMVVLGLVSPAEARQSVDWSVLVVIGAAIGLGQALEASGGASLLAEGIARAGAPLGPRGILASLMAATMLFTLTITNNAAVAIVIPVALAIGGREGLDVRPLVVAVTIGASLAFATPLGYQTNLMVYGPGGYRFLDFLRAGLPLQLLLGVVAVLLIPWIWPL
jgi:di/tricarboxylate transporter